MRTRAVILLLCLLAGCNAVNQTRTKTDDDRNRISGTWQNTGEKSQWTFVLEKDGTISEIFRPDGLHMIVSEGAVKKETGLGFFAHYIFGPCTWTYDASSNILKATVVIDEFYVKANDSELSCSMTDEFEGILSADGMTWNANYLNITRYDSPPREQKIEGKTILIFSKQQ